MEQGLAASAVTNMYGSGSGNNTTHYYAGVMNRKKKTKPTKGKK